MLCPGLLAETFTVHGEAGAWRFSFRVPARVPIQVPAETATSTKPALEHSDFRAWHQGRAVSVTGHKLEFTRGPWGYTFSIQPNQTAARFTIFNHTSLGELWFDSEPDIVRFRPGWYRFGAGHSLGLKGATAVLRIEGESEDSDSEGKASSFALLLTGLLAGAWITAYARRPNDVA